MPAVTSELTSVLLPPPKGKWTQREFQNFQKSTMMNVAMMLNHRDDPMMTKIAQLSGMAAERWATNDNDLSTESGFAQAEQRLRSIRPRRLWLSPECGPFSQVQNVNQGTPKKIEDLVENAREGSNSGEIAFVWHGCNWSWADISTSSSRRPVWPGNWRTRSPANCWTDFRRIAIEVNVLRIWYTPKSGKP